MLSVLSSALPQPDQLCGPFSAFVALAAVLDDGIPSVTALAVASGSTTWPGGLPGARPPGVPVLHDGWDSLPTAAGPDKAGTNASGLAQGIENATDHDVAVIAVARPGARDLRKLLVSLTRSRLQFGILANVRTRSIVDFDWDVGHFVAVWGFDDYSGDVAIADTYAELGVAGMPSGCRLVSSEALADAMSADDGRGLLLLVPAHMRDSGVDLVGDLGMDTRLWST